MKPDCSFKGCTHPQHSKGYCQPHYDQYRRVGWGGMHTLKPRVKLCTVSGCSSPVRNSPQAVKCEDHVGVCAVAGCDTSSIKPASSSRGPTDQRYCGLHKARKTQGKALTDPPRQSNWAPNNNGYIVMNIYVNGVRVKTRVQHREVMEEKIGRPLVRGENVHHINGDRADNRPENLELWSTSQPSGQRVADKIRYAKEIISRYGIDPTIYEGKSHK